VVADVPGAPRRAGETAWEATLSPAQPGIYVVELLREGDDAVLAPPALFEVLPAPGESDNLSADHQLLGSLASESGGGVYELARVGEALDAIAPEAREVSDESQAVWDPAWDRGSLLILVLAAFGGEWFLRRRNGLL
jgi:hypothetical protein